MLAELLGVWDIAASGCTGQGNPDSDTRLVITPAGIDSYEQTFKTVKAASVSHQPHSVDTEDLWRIQWLPGALCAGRWRSLDHRR